MSNKTALSRKVYYGKVDYFGTANRKINEVSLEFSINRGYFSICGGIWNSRNTDIVSGGQNIREIVEILESVGMKHRVEGVLDMWNAFHLKSLSHIPHRFLKIIKDFISGERENLSFDKHRARIKEFYIKEHHNDLSVYTEGKAYVHIEDINILEVIHFSQSSEKDFPIRDRMKKRVGSLYSIESFDGIREVLDFNEGEYRKKVEKKRQERAAEIEKLHLKISNRINQGDFGEDDWRVLYRIKDLAVALGIEV